MTKTNRLLIDAIGGRQKALLVEPDDAPRAVAGIIPALGIRAGYYDEFMEVLGERGIASLVTDLPGQGDSPIQASRNTQWTYRHLVHEMAESVHGRAREVVPDVPFFWIGHSVGGQVGMMHAGLRSDAVEGVALVASGSPHLQAWSSFQRFKFSMGTAILRATAAILGYLPGQKLGFGGREASDFIRDWYRTTRTGSFTTPEFDGDALLAAFRARVLVLAMYDDDQAPLSSANLLVEKTPATDVTRDIIEAQHAVGHNRWPRTVPEDVADHIRAWLS